MLDIDDIRRILRGTAKTTIDETLDDSDKEFVVPAGKTWTLRSVYVKLISTATVGARRVVVLVRTAADKVLCIVAAGATQAASLTYEYSFAPGLPQAAAVVNNVLLAPLPDGMALPAGSKVRVYDIAAIAPAADDMTVDLLYSEQDEQ